MRIQVGQRQDKYPVLQSFLKVQLLHLSEQMLLQEPGQRFRISAILQGAGTRMCS